MTCIWTWICNLAYQCGSYGAGQPSYHGSYEADVPEALKNSKN